MRGTNEGAEAPPSARFCDFRPRLRHDALYTDNGDGALLHHPQSRFVIKGASAYALMRTLAPHLDGRTTVEELCGGLATPQRDAVLNILDSLAQRGFVRDAPPGTDSGLPDTVLRRFADQINYVDHYADDAAARFARFRATRVLVPGTGDVDRAAALGLVRNGAAAVYVRAPEPTGHAWDDLEAEAADLRADGCPTAVHQVALSRADALVGGGTATNDSTGDAPGWDYVVLSPGEGSAAALWRHMTEGPADGPVPVPIVPVGNLAIAGPMTLPGQAPCWCCAALRTSAGLGPAASASLWRELALPTVPAGDIAPGAPVAAMLGTMAAFDIFRHRTGALAAETDGGVVIQDATTLESVRETLLPHPLCPRCGDPAVEPPASELTREAPKPAPDEDDEHDADAPDVLFGEVTGVFAGYADTEVTQSPLKVGAVRLPLPDRPGGSREITAFDTHTVTVARRRASNAAATCYADAATRTRDSVARRAPEDAETAGARVTPEELATWSGLSGDQTSEPWLPATSMVHGHVRSLPAAAVFPLSAGNTSARFEVTPAGAGCGPDMGRAAAAGLLSALAYDGLRAALHRTAPLATIAPTTRDADAETDFLLRTAANLDCRPLLLDMGGAAPAHAVLAVERAGTEPPRWSVGAGLRRRDAAVAALRDLLGLLQLDTAGRDADIGDAPIPGLDPRALLTDATRPPAERDPTSHAALLDALHEGGRDAYVADTTPVDLRAAGLRTARVVLTR